MLAAYPGSTWPRYVSKVVHPTQYCRPSWQVVANRWFVLTKMKMSPAAHGAVLHLAATCQVVVDKEHARAAWTARCHLDNTSSKVVVIPCTADVTSNDLIGIQRECCGINPPEQRSDGVAEFLQRGRPSVWERPVVTFPRLETFNRLHMRRHHDGFYVPLSCFSRGLIPMSCV